MEMIGIVSRLKPLYQKEKILGNPGTTGMFRCGGGINRIKGEM
jgi:hypothetical protein